LLPNSSVIVSCSSWETCDSNANCGGYMWEHLWYHSQVTLSPQSMSNTIFLRMSWEPVTVDGQPRQIVYWYYNTTGTPWTQFGSSDTVGEDCPMKGLRPRPISRTPRCLRVLSSSPTLVER